MHRLPVRGDGGCLFTSLRLSLELRHVLAGIANGTAPPRFNLDGHHSSVVTSGFLLRQRICDWFRIGLNEDVPMLGMYIEKGPDARPWKRGDLLAMEMVKGDVDIPENGEERQTCMMKYLLKMMNPSCWGGTPEYTAAAVITGCNLEIYQAGEVISSIPQESTFTIKLLFNERARHYECLLTTEQISSLRTHYGEQVVSQCCPSLITHPVFEYEMVENYSECPTSSEDLEAHR